MHATDYTWILNPLNGNSVYDYGWSCDIAFYNSGSYQLVVQAQNTCGPGPYTGTGVYVYDSKSLSITPNPSNVEVTISIGSTNEKRTCCRRRMGNGNLRPKQVVKGEKNQPARAKYKNTNFGLERRGLHGACKI